MKILVMVLNALMLLVGTGSGKSAQGSSAMEVSENELRTLATKTVLFGHQSVGANILDGLSALQQETMILKINKISQAAELKKSAFNHIYIGKNQDPYGKIDDFSRMVDALADAPPDIILLKFCYLDIDDHTDVERLFNMYKKGMADLKARYPQVAIIHATVPLRALQHGPKAWIKRLLGKPVTGYNDNVARARYNQLVRTEYGAQDKIFDLAELESVRLDGTRESLVQGGITYAALAPEYTDDGDHLNTVGSKKLAAALVHLLAEGAARSAADPN